MTSFRRRIGASRVRSAIVLIGIGIIPLLLHACGGDGDGAAPTTFQQVNLVSDQNGTAAQTDVDLVNPWGIALGPTTAFWISDNHSGVSTLYNGSGTPFPVGSPLVVTIPPPEGADSSTGSPTGIVFNATSDFGINEDDKSGPALFIFATEDGTLAGWNQNVDLHNALLTYDGSGAEAIYKGLAIASSGTQNFLYATDFHNGAVAVFDKNFAPVTMPGGFSDSNIPAGFAPFGIQALGSSLYVTYAQQDEDGEDDVAGAGNGFVDVFDTTGHLMRRFASRGVLDSPWGLVVAPDTFGTFAGMLLVGNFGDGRINAFDTSGSFRGTLTNSMGQPISIAGLWGLAVGNGANGGDAKTVYFTAGPGDEEHGLFGSLHPTAG